MENSQMSFRAAESHQPVSILVLLENSHALSQVWADLRDKCIDRLVGGIHFANPTDPITLSVLESSHYGTNEFIPRQYADYHDGLRNIEFDENPDNKISRGHIQSCIEFLESTHILGQVSSLHLIIVAATSPSEVYGNEHPSWVTLANKMGSSNIHCHLVLSPQHGMESFTVLFEETLRVQGNIEEFLIPPVDLTHAVVRLSARPKYNYYQDIRASSSSSTIVRGGIPRRNSYPLDNFYPETFDEVTGTPHPTANEGDQPPSLVSQLQQVHGLTKKKVYGTKPARQPFFRDERVKFRAPPAPLTMPLSIMDSVPSPTNGGRAISQSRLDRMHRISQSQAPIPSDIHRRQHSGWTRRGSRLSTPEADHQTWPSSVHDELPLTPTNLVSSALSSPVSPIPAAVPPSSSTHGVSPIYQNVGTTEGNWMPMQPQQQLPMQPQQQHGSFNPGMPPYMPYTPPPPPPPPPHYSGNGFAYETILSQQPLISSPYLPQNPAQVPIHTTPPPPLAVPSQAALHQKTTLTPPATTPVPRGPSDKLSALPPSSLSKKTAQEDADEERFSFSNDFVAATAALFEAEVLPAYPNYPGMSSGLFTNGNQETLSALPPAQTGELYASRDRRQPPNIRPVTSTSSNPNIPHSYPHLNNSHSVTLPAQGHPATHSHVSSVMDSPAAYSFAVPSYAPSYGSSLTGWAG